jgi:hypothetical protein
MYIHVDGGPVDHPQRGRDRPLRGEGRAEGRPAQHPHRRPAHKGGRLAALTNLLLC